MRWFSSVWGACAVVAALVATVGGAAAQSGLPDTMPVHGVVAAPKAFVDFCARAPAECAPGVISDSRFVLDDRRRQHIEGINRQVNRIIEPATDHAIYGVDELWALPVSGRGDCEDYALLKRHILLRQGWPASALLLTIVLDQNNDGHAVLTVRTDRGDFILDNRENRMLLWHQTGYRFLMRQSFASPMQWMALGNGHGSGNGAAVAVSSQRRR